MIENSERYFETLAELFGIEKKTIDNLANTILHTINADKAVWLIGNGGSASTADHFAVDLSFVRNFPDRTSVRVQSLCSNNGLLTAIANDIGFENVFSHQLIRSAKKGDLLIAISASGNSTNLVKAFEICREMGVSTIAILGFDGGQLLNIADRALLIESKVGLYGPVEDLHLMICHHIAKRLRQSLFGEEL